MNDRFKFRAFDTFTEKMIQNHISICEGELYEWCPDGLHIKHDIGDSAIVMQCTGLKDKNGKLIYEGDIVRKTVFIDYQGDGTFQPDVYVDREYIGVVHFSASNGATLQKLIILETESPYEPKKLRDKKECPKVTKLAACRSEVLGNIYENPELLKECE